MTAAGVLAFVPQGISSRDWGRRSRNSLEFGVPIYPLGSLLIAGRRLACLPGSSRSLFHRTGGKSSLSICPNNMPSSALAGSSVWSERHTSSCCCHTITHKATRGLYPGDLAVSGDLAVCGYACKSLCLCFQTLVTIPCMPVCMLLLYRLGHLS